jgi:hypothetical protein
MPPPHQLLNEMEQNILEALGSDTLTGQQLAERAGYPSDSGTFRQVLASMVRRGVLGNMRPGYYVMESDEEQPQTIRADAPHTSLTAITNMLAHLAEAGEELDVTIKIRGVLATLKVGPAAGGKRELAADGKRLSEIEENILEALGSETLTGEHIAERAGYPSNSNFRTALSGMVRRGILGNANPGYFLIISEETE